MVCDTQEVKSWHDYYDYCDNNDELVEWYAGYKGRKTQRANIDEDLMPIAWNTSRWCDWCVPEDEKRERKIMGAGHWIMIFCFVSGDRIQNIFDQK